MVFCYSIIPVMAHVTVKSQSVFMILCCKYRLSQLRTFVQVDYTPDNYTIIQQTWYRDNTNTPFATSAECRRTPLQKRGFAIDRHCTLRYHKYNAHFTLQAAET